MLVFVVLIFVVLIFVVFVFVVFVFVVLVFVMLIFVVLIFVVLIFVVLVFVVLIFVVLVFVVPVFPVPAYQTPELQIGGQIHHPARFDVGEQVAQEFSFQAGAVDEYDGCVRYLAGIAGRRPKEVRVGADRQHHVQGDIFSPDLGDDVPGDGGGGDDRHLISARLRFAFSESQSRHESEDDGTGARRHGGCNITDHAANNNDNELSKSMRCARGARRGSPTEIRGTGASRTRRRARTALFRGPR